jgi:nucleotide-binding universal stress UspA family protein
MARPEVILAASDLSANSEIALRRAVFIAREHGARLELLHVLENSSSLSLPEGIGDERLFREAIREAEERLQRQAEKTVGQDIPLRCRVEVGKDFVVIIRHARQVAAGLVVMAAHGSHSIRDRFLGTTPEKVVRKGEFPVLTVRKPPVGAYERVLVATDFSEGSQRALLTTLALAPGARIDLLHVYELWGQGRLALAGGGEDALARYHQMSRGHAETKMDEFLQGIDLAGRQIERHFRHGHPSTLISQMAGELKAELVATGTEGRSGLPYILLGSVAEHVLLHAPCDVLTVRPSDFRFELP